MTIAFGCLLVCPRSSLSADLGRGFVVGADRLVARLSDAFPRTAAAFSHFAMELHVGWWISACICGTELMAGGHATRR